MHRWDLMLVAYPNTEDAPERIEVTDTSHRNSIWEAEVSSHMWLGFIFRVSHVVAFEVRNANSTNLFTRVKIVASRKWHREVGGV
jgi:hypothetical protein